MIMKNNKNVIITGGGGYIGSHAVKAFLKKGFSVTVFENFSTGHKEPLTILKKYGNLKVVEGDLRNAKDVEKLLKGKKSDAIVHFAAACSVDESMKDPSK